MKRNVAVLMAVSMVFAIGSAVGQYRNRCYICSGSGTCIMCNGAGQVGKGRNRTMCEYCNGTGRCAVCGGGGYSRF